MRPEILILDEPVSALDVSIQAQIIGLLMRLQLQYEISYVFISHDLPLVRLVADEVVVMYMGIIVEQGTVKELFEEPKHPYTKLLMDSSPHKININKNSNQKSIELSNPLYLPIGCRFQIRCSFKTAVCGAKEPELDKVGESLTHRCACFHPLKDKCES